MRDDQPSVITIPAAPGWHLSVLCPGADELAHHPIVAWEITRYDPRPMKDDPERREPVRRYLTPISTNGNANANVARIDGWLVCDPDGRYHDPCNALCNLDASEALALLKRAARARSTLAPEEG
jgi:hypothetical protein